MDLAEKHRLEYVREMIKHAKSELYDAISEEEKRMTEIMSGPMDLKEFRRRSMQLFSIIQVANHLDTARRCIDMAIKQ